MYALSGHASFYYFFRFRRTLAVLAVLFLFLHPANAQDPNYITLDKSKGLPSNNVYNLFQDSKGFIWICTEEGLSRYDGYQFKTYFNPAQTSKAGSEIHEDVYGRIWYENFDGYLYYIENDSLHAFKQHKTGCYFPFGLSKKTLFHISEKGVELYDLKTLALRKTIPLANTEALVYAHGSGELYYVGKNNDLSVFDDFGEIKHISSERDQKKMIATSNGGLWFYDPSPPCVVSYFSESSILPLFTNQNNTFIHSTSFSGDHVWFCSSSGTYAYSTTGLPLENGHTFFAGKSISCVFKDREANYWFCTTNEGILFVPDFYSRRLVPEKNIRRLTLYNDQLLFGTQNGELWVLDSTKTQPRFKSTTGHSVDFLASGDEYAPLCFTMDSFFISADNTFLLKHPVSLKDLQPIAPGTYACALTGYAGLFFAKNSPDNPWKHLSWGHSHNPDDLTPAFGY
ncbi:MAG: ligand-binding sensor domain-containing protein, partial [Bacteroidia bacterium]